MANYAALLGKLAQRFGLTVTQVGEGTSQIYPVVLPITDLDALALEPFAEQIDYAVIANGYNVNFECPPGERRHVQWWMVDANAADYSYQPVFRREATIGGTYVNTPLDAIQPDGAAYFPPVGRVPVLMFPGDRISFNFSSFVSGATFSFLVAYLREECSS